MEASRREMPSVYRFLLVMLVAAIAGAVGAREYGEQVTDFLSPVPATDRGWQFIGWLLAGPPVLFYALAWMDRGRFYLDQLQWRATVYGSIFGLGAGFVVPAFASGSYDLFGDGIGLGNPLAFGWSCGAIANLAALLFAAGIDTLRVRSGSRVPRAVTLRFVEVAWMVLIVASMLFACYGRELGFSF